MSSSTAPLFNDHPPIICTLCGHTNPAGDAVWCAACWGVLALVAAAPGQKVLTAEEREQRIRRDMRIRRALMGSITTVVGLILAIQFLNITLPLPATASSVSSESGPGEWAMIHRDFEGPSPIIGENAAFTGRVRWTFKTIGPLVSTPAVKGGRVYLTTRDGRVVALNAATGNLIWEHDTGVAVDSSPAVAGDLVFYGARDKRVVALDADTGEMRWEFVTEDNPNAGSPKVKDGVVYIGSGDGNIYALDALTGEKRWSHPTRDWITNTPALSDDILVISAMDGWVTVYDTDTGKKRFSLRGFGQMVMGSPIIMEESIYVPYRNGTLTSVNLREKEVLFQSRLYRLRMQLWIWDIMGYPGPPKGVNWSIRLGGTLVKTPAADEDAVYVPTEQGTLYALDRRTGRRLWVYQSGAFELSTPTVVEDVVLVGDSQGRLHAVNKESGEDQWVLQIAERSTSIPVLADGTLYLASKDGTLYAVE